MGAAGLRGAAALRHFAAPVGHPHEPSDRGGMEPAAIVTFAVIGGFVWGGFILLLTKAIRKEREKGAGE